MRTACRSIPQQEKAAKAKPSVEKCCVYGFSGSALIQELITADVITAVMLTLISAGLGEENDAAPAVKIPANYLYDTFTKQPLLFLQLGAEMEPFPDV